MKVAMCWSGGKDSCVALRQLRASTDIEVTALLTTVTSDFDRISMHGVPRSLLHLQAQSLGLPLVEAFIPPECPNAHYEASMATAFAQLRDEGVRTLAFGDLFLEDIRAYRDALAARNSMEAIYPVWGRSTAEFLGDFIADGFKAVTCCVDLDVMTEDFAGRMLDDSFASDLPKGVDPCGENGEFHTFVFDGPGFASPVPLSIGPHVVRGRFCFCDLQPVNAGLAKAGAPAI